MTAALLALPALLLAAVPAAFWLAARSRRVDAGDAPHRPVGLVLGARPLPGGVPTELFAARLEVALRLLKAGKVERLLLSGLPDEVELMRSWLLARGACAGQLVLDAPAPRTIVSLRRARDAFGLRELLVVTNPFHLPRTLWIARRLGLRAIGVEAPARHPLSACTRLRNAARELAAQLRALADRPRS